MTNLWNKLKYLLEELFFPEADRCPICGKEGGFCETCRDALREQRAGGDSAFYYGSIVKDMIHRLKFGDQPYLAKIMAELMDEELELSGELITCVPLHKKRRRQRGYNQSEDIAREISHITGIPFRNLLRRIRNTSPQSLLKKRTDRLNNIRDAFVPLDRDVSGKHILLVDDVITTGATIGECRRILLEAGAASVRRISFARGNDHGNSEDSAQESVGEE